MTIKQYLDDLGITNFEFEGACKNQTLANDSATIVQFLIVEENNHQHSFLQQSPTRDLLTKMFGAIGVNIAETTCISEKDIAKYDAKVVIFVGEFKNQEFIIPHPNDIITTPDLKRDAWEVLKKIKEII